MKIVLKIILQSKLDDVLRLRSETVT